jgi:hypothetical protein
MPISFKGFNEIKIGMTDMDKQNKQYVRSVLNALAVELITLIREYAPEFTGNYKRKWDIQKRTDTSITVGLPEGDQQLRILFNIKEFTGITVPFILPKSKKALHWKDPFTGEDVFVKYVTVDSPLQKNPQPHFRPAIKDLKRRIKGIMYVEARKHFTFLQKAMPASEVQRFVGARTNSKNFGGVNRNLAQKTGRKRLRKHVRRSNYTNS